MKENLVYNLSRLFVGIFIVLVLIITYFFNLDLILYIILISLIFYELYKSMLNEKFIIIASFFFSVLQFFINFFLVENYIYLIFFSLISLLCSILFKRYLRIFFILFVVNIISLIANLFFIDKNIIYLIISISFINDTTAYILGSYIKGPLISPKISPKKTWSGTLTSFFITTLLLIILEYNLIVSSIMAISLFYGDIYFSYIKRKLNIKDFSNLLYSHGGILDRIDSISFLIIIFGILHL